MNKRDVMSRIARGQTLIAFVALSILFAAYAQQVTTYTIPGDAVFPEGVAYDAATGDFYVGSTRDGAVYRGNVRNNGGELDLFLEPNSNERQGITGMKVDTQGRLFIAGRRTGQAFVYDTSSGDLVATLTTPNASNTLINDVTLTEDAAYFTDSFRPTLFRVPLTSNSVGEMEAWLELNDTSITYQNGFNLNGIAATADGRYLLTVQFNTGELYRIDTQTKEVTQVVLGGERLTTGDGLVLEGRALYAVREKPAEIVVVNLSENLLAGEVRERITDPSLDFPTTLALTGERLLVVNSQLDTASPTLPFTVSSLPLP